MTVERGDRNLVFRKADEADLLRIIEMLAADEFGKTRERTDEKSLEIYAAAFAKISADKNHFLAVVELDKKIVGTCHLTIIPSIVIMASTRMNIEAVRVAEEYSNQGIGSWMMNQVIEFAKQHDVKILQLTTNKARKRAHKFYENLGFVASHEGMKLSLAVTNAISSAGRDL